MLNRSKEILNPEFAIGRGIRRTMLYFFFLKKFIRCPCIVLTFFVEKVSASLVSVLTPIAKSGLNPADKPKPKVVVCSGGCMRPLLKNDQPVFVEPAGKLAAGDIACYNVNGGVFIHRIVKLNNLEVVAASDSSSIKPHQLERGQIIGVVRSRNPFFSGILGLAFHYLISFIFSAGRCLKRKSSKKKIS